MLVSISILYSALFILSYIYEKYHNPSFKIKKNVFWKKMFFIWLSVNQSQKAKTKQVLQRNV